jgi:hypothetical protein
MLGFLFSRQIRAVPEASRAQSRFGNPTSPRWRRVRSLLLAASEMDAVTGRRRNIHQLRTGNRKDSSLYSPSARRPHLVRETPSSRFQHLCHRRAGLKDSQRQLEALRQLRSMPIAKWRKSKQLSSSYNRTQSMTMFDQNKASECHGLSGQH